MDACQWNYIVKAIKRAESTYSSYVSTDILRNMNAARSLLNFKTMTPVNGKKVEDATQIFSGIAIGIDVHATSHMDDNYTHSIVTNVTIQLNNYQ